MPEVWECIRNHCKSCLQPGDFPGTMHCRAAELLASHSRASAAVCYSMDDDATLLQMAPGTPLTAKRTPPMGYQSQLPLMSGMPTAYSVKSPSCIIITIIINITTSPLSPPSPSLPPPSPPPLLPPALSSYDYNRCR